MATECEIFASTIGKEMFGDDITLEDAKRLTKKLKSFVDKDTSGDNIVTKYARAAELLKEEWDERDEMSDKAARLTSYKFLSIQNRLRSAVERGESHYQSYRNYLDELGQSNANWLQILLGGQQGKSAGLLQMIDDKKLTATFQNPNYELELAQ